MFSVRCKGIVFLVLFLFLVAGCAMSKASWDSNSVTNIKKGMPQEQVIQLLGQPASRSIQDDVESWTYNKPSAQKATTNKVITIASFGMTNGAWLDVLSIEFKKAKVSSVKYSENVPGGLTSFYK